jgi:hypothetical protein
MGVWVRVDVCRWYDRGMMAIPALIDQIWVEHFNSVKDGGQIVLACQCQTKVRPLKIGEIHMKQTDNSRSTCVRAHISMSTMSVSRPPAIHRFMRTFSLSVLAIGLSYHKDVSAESLICNVVLMRWWQASVCTAGDILVENPWLNTAHHTRFVWIVTNWFKMHSWCRGSVTPSLDYRQKWEGTGERIRPRCRSYDNRNFGSWRAIIKVRNEVNATK